MELFDALNPYQTLLAVTEDTPDALVERIKKIRTPIAILAFVAYGNRHTAYLMGDTRMAMAEAKKQNNKLKGVK